MKKIIILIAAITISACAAPRSFVHPTKSAQQFEEDKYDCEQQATQYVANRGFSTASFGVDPFMVRDETVRCLKIKKGWREE